MSDVSVLSQEYQTASELSETINRALILLKKAHWGFQEGEPITPEELNVSRRSLAELVSALIAWLDPVQDGQQEAARVIRVPGVLLSQLSARHRGNLPYYVDDLRGVLSRLTNESTELTDADLKLLDDLSAVADAETSDVFRRLMRK